MEKLQKLLYPRWMKEDSQKTIDLGKELRNEISILESQLQITECVVTLEVERRLKLNNEMKNSVVQIKKLQMNIQGIYL